MPPRATDETLGVTATKGAAPPRADGFVAARRRLAARLFVFAAAVAAIASASVAFRRMSRRREGARATALAWARYSRCLLGAPLATGESARERMLRMELSLPESAGATDRQDWPARCAPVAADLHGVVMTFGLDDVRAYRRLSAAAARASVTDASTWSADPGLADELWTAAASAELPPAASKPIDSFAPPPAPAPILTKGALPELPVAPGSTSEARPSRDPDKVVVAFSHAHASGETLCAFGPGARGEALESAHCEDGSGVLLEREPAPAAFIRTAQGHFDRFELVRPRVDKEPWIDALSPDTRAAALFGEQLVYVRPGPLHPDLLFARAATLASAGKDPLGDPVALGTLDGRSHEFATCATREALVVRVRSYDSRLSEQEPDQSRAAFAFFAEGQWSHPPDSVTTSSAATLTCRGREGTLTWVQGDAVAQARCDPAECVKRSSGPLLRAWTHMQRLAVADLDGKAIVVGVADGSGPLSPSLVHSVRMRLGPIDHLEDAPDVVLWGDAQHDGVDAMGVKVFATQGAAVVLITTSDGANRAVRVDPGGSFAPIEIVKS